MTYKKIQSIYFEAFGMTIKTCWIAEVKRDLGLIKRVAHNRISIESIKNTCPTEEIYFRIKQILQK